MSAGENEAMDPERNPTILVVDDEAPIRELLMRIVESNGYQAVLAADVEEALKVLTTASVDAMLLDLHMPGEYDGEELLFLLRDRGDNIPIIVVSGWVDDESTINNPDCVHAVLKKPIHTESLLAALSSALGQPAG
jgi:two-component system, OmpR family, KDP operon response regulator KdpE